MSEQKLVIAISSLSAALAEAGLNNVTITVGANVLAQNVTTTINETKTDETKGGRGRRNADKDADKEETAATDKEEAKDEKATSGRGRGRGAANKETAEAETKGRRGRNSNKEDKKPEPINDNDVQAEIRARLVQDLLTLADHDEAIDDVTAALANAGATNIKAVPSAALEALDDAIGAIFDKYDL